MRQIPVHYIIQLYYPLPQINLVIQDPIMGTAKKKKLNIYQIPFQHSRCE